MVILPGSINGQTRKRPVGQGTIVQLALHGLVVDLVEFSSLAGGDEPVREHALAIGALQGQRARRVDTGKIPSMGVISPIEGG